MEQKFNYSWFGYDPSAVQDKIDLMNKDYEKTVQGLDHELAIIKGESNGLKEKICGQVEEISLYENATREINDILFLAHMQATERVYKSSKNAEQMAINIREAVLEREKEFERLKNTLKRLTGEMRSITHNYEPVSEVSENE